MAFPAPVGTPTIYADSTGTLSTHPVTLPSGMTIGNKLFILFIANGSPVVTDPTGYTLLGSTATPGTYDSVRLYGRDVDGSEGATINVVLNAVQRACAISWEVSGGRPSFTSSEVAVSAVSEQGSTAVPDPPNLSPVPGADDYLWVSISTRNDGTGSFISYSTNYSLGQQNVLNGTGAGNGLAVCMRQLNAASEDPGVITWGNSKPATGITLAIRAAELVSIAPGNKPLAEPGRVPFLTTLRTFIKTADLSLVSKDQFLGAGQFPTYDWPLPQQPKRPVSNLTHIDSLKLFLLGQDVFFGPGQFPRYDWPLPKPLPRNSTLFTWTQSLLTIPIPTPPITYVEWPQPTPKVLPIGLRTWINTLILTSTPPISSYIWPIPVQPKRAQAFFSMNAIVVLTTPTVFPRQQAMMVNPQWRRYPNALRTWTSFTIVPTERVSAFILG